MLELRAGPRDYRARRLRLIARCGPGQLKKSRMFKVPAQLDIAIRDFNLVNSWTAIDV
jgi:hypothetical protein